MKMNIIQKLMKFLRFHSTSPIIVADDIETGQIVAIEIGLLGQRRINRAAGKRRETILGLATNEGGEISVLYWGAITNMVPVDLPFNAELKIQNSEIVIASATGLDNDWRDAQQEQQAGYLQ